MGVMPGLKAFVAAVLGGIGIIPVPCWVVYYGHCREFDQRLYFQSIG